MADRDSPPTDPGDELPTYQNLEAEAQAEGGASAARWNRWRGWIEKRAAERYAENPHQARRPTGWGPSNDDVEDREPSPSPAGPRDRSPKRQDTRISLPPPDYALPEPSGSPGQLLDPSRLSLHSFGSRFLPHATDKIYCMLPILQDRFLLIGSAQGLSVLDVHPSLHPRKGDQPLALNTNSSAQPLADAIGIPIWFGEAVYQLDLLEDANSELMSDNPQGVVLALVGPTEDEVNRSLRMYNLGSLSSLVRWYSAQQDQPPLDIRKTAASTQNCGPSLSRHRIKKARPQSELAKGFKSLIVDELKVSSSAASPIAPERSQSPTQLTSPTTSPGKPSLGISPYQSAYAASSSPSSASSTLPPPPLPHTGSTSSLASTAWDVVDDLPIRWATDYIPFASPNSRLSNVPVSFYEMRKSSDGKTPTSLAVATRTNILLYETPRNERAFKFVKEFYTPLPAKSVTFIQQSDPSYSTNYKQRSSRSTATDGNHVQDLHRRSSSGPGSLSKRRPGGGGDYGIQLCLFVAFEKKAGLIRVGDAAVMEVEPFPDLALASNAQYHRSRPSLSTFSGEATSPVSGGSIRRHLVQSLDGNGFWKNHPPWLPLHELILPLLVPPPLSTSLPNSPRPVFPPDSICFITRGRTTQIYPVPLPMSFGNPASSPPPMKTLTWQYQPTRIQARVSLQADLASQDDGEPRGPPPPFLQVIAFGDNGVEVQELSLDFVWQSATKVDAKDKGKSKATGPSPSDVIVRAYADVGGPAGLLCVGGHWDKPVYTSPVDGAQLRSPVLSRQDTWASVDSFATATASPYAGSASSHAPARPAVDVTLGVYGWAMKGVEDWRIFWLGEGAAC